MQNTNEITVNNEKKEFFNNFNQSTHVIKTICTNYNGKQKTFFAFVDATNKGGWYDHYYRNTDNKYCANGSVLGRLETINANVGNLFRKDKSIREYQTTIFKINPFKEFIKFNKQTNQ